ncbi:hypothetical protein ACLOAV_003865 [Pseudogymnoascus australis]
MTYFPQATYNSPELLLSFPQEIVQSIFEFFLAESLYNSDRYISETRSCRFVALSQVVRTTKGIRGACSSWAEVARFMLFRGRLTRAGLVVKLKRLLTGEEIKTFPLLRDCLVRLCHPYAIHDVYALQLDLAKITHSLEYVWGLDWRKDYLMNVMRGAVDGMGYARLASDFVTTFTDECIAAGLQIVDAEGRRPNGGDASSSEGLKEAGLQAMKNFFFKELLALWYYNAQMARQILSKFPELEYLVLPAFLHIPLLADVSYFFPQSTGESPFAPVSLAPPQMLQNLGITYKEGGRRYSDIMASIKVVSVRSIQYNPILAMFCLRFRRINQAMLPILVFNRWSHGRDCEVGQDLIDMLHDHAKDALSSIPDRRKPKVLDLELLKGVMDEPYN